MPTASDPLLLSLPYAAAWTSIASNQVFDQGPTGSETCTLLAILTNIDIADVVTWTLDNVAFTGAPTFTQLGEDFTLYGYSNLVEGLVGYNRYSLNLGSGYDFNNFSTTITDIAISAYVNGVLLGTLHLSIL